ncbi:hypothetical protein [Levilactobacillus brevis]|uniref:hypothetical protein n=1 Tax=Levilactobacillus brevis TaxID=1580 RepID=UPI0025A1960C|nr:hypothetical protein [Levilactobacillus brevis]MDM7552468.1 hypothetical protein [Levilactobacillus brevis]MDM7649215.1 hypothetical protein [Levilactobacillus brevis]
MENKFVRVLLRSATLIILLGVLFLFWNHTRRVTVSVSNQSVSTKADQAIKRVDTISDSGDSASSESLNQYLISQKFSGTALVVKNSHVVFQKSYANADYYYRVPNQVDTVYPSNGLSMMVNIVMLYQMINSNELNGKEKLSSFNVTGRFKNVALSAFLAQAKNVYQYAKYYETAWKSLSLTQKEFNQMSETIVKSANSMSYAELLRENIIQNVGLNNFGTYSMLKNANNIAKNYQTHRGTISYTDVATTLTASTIVASPLSVAIFEKLLLENQFNLSNVQLANIKKTFSNGANGLRIKYSDHSQYFYTNIRNKGENITVVMGNYMPQNTTNKQIMKLAGQTVIEEK